MQLYARYEHQKNLMRWYRTELVMRIIQNPRDTQGNANSGWSCVEREKDLGQFSGHSGFHLTSLFFWRLLQVWQGTLKYSKKNLWGLLKKDVYRLDALTFKQSTVSKHCPGMILNKSDMLKLKHAKAVICTNTQSRVCR